MSDLDATEIAAAVRRRAPAWGARVVALAETGSTNDVAKDLAREGAPEGTLVVADAQTAGRGRSGAAWHSPPGENLYASVLLRPAVAPAAALAFTLVAGLAVAEIVSARLSAPALVKWPNDVLVGDKKLSGVLVEGQTRGGELAALIVGVGLNVRTRAFPAPLDALATSLALEGARDLARGGLAAELTAGLLFAVRRYEAAGLAPSLEGLRARDALLGRHVDVDGVAGVARGIDDTGALLLERRDGVTTAIVTGHVTLRDGRGA